MADINYGSLGEVQSSRRIWIIVIIAVAVFAAILIYIVTGNRKAQPIPAAPTPKAMVRAIENRGQVTFPAIAKAGTSTLSALPVALRTLFDQAPASGVSVETLGYKDGRTGFALQYVTTGTVTEIFAQLARHHSQWQALYSERTDSLAVYQAQNATYEVQVLLTPRNDGHLNVAMQSIKK